LSALPVEQSTSTWIEIAYQEQETTARDVPMEQSASVWAELGVQEQETVERVAPALDEPTVVDTTVSGGVWWLKVVQNIVAFAFAGKAYLFDGSEFRELGTPVAVIYPVAVSDGSAAYLAGGLEEGGGVPESLYGFNVESYVLVADRDYLAMVVAGGSPVYAVDTGGAVAAEIRGVATVPLLAGWRLVSRSPFVAILQRI